MNGYGISLVTYSYNDHDFANALIAYARGFGVPFQEMIVVDDASRDPFVAREAENRLIKCLRLNENAGSAHVKRHGLNAASGGIVFSMDADIRPHAKWLMDSLALLKDPAVGLIGASCIPGRTAGYLGAALHRTFSAKREVEEVSYTSGGCWLFRKDVWERIGGIDDLPLDAFEDIFFCRKLLAGGYRIVRNNRYPVYETRNLHRTAYCRRTVNYFSAAVAPIVNKFGPERYLHDLLPELRVALDYFQRQSDPVLGYVFLLKTAFMFHIMRRQSLVADSVGSAASCILGALAGHPETAALFRRDMAALGMEETKTPPPLLSFLPHIQQLAEVGALGALEEKWIAMYREEDKKQFFDRHYTEAHANPLQQSS